jgi:BlaR1 peptidase M56
VRDRVSPMIWCGVSPKLILPIGLWGELDDAGRRAVIHHELAHLKRRDHWLRWAELVIGCVYWWHPMVWWVRRKLREEADNCCDAWVTALLPTERRAYASALVRTKAYLNHPHSTPGPVGLGVTTATAKRFARRLTMVMTHRSNPRLSATGLLLAATFAALTAVATPIWACPTERSRDKEVERAMRESPPPAPEAPPAVGADESTYERFIKSQEQAPQPDEVESRLNNLDERLQRALVRIERLLASQVAPVPGVFPTPPTAPAPPSFPQGLSGFTSQPSFGAFPVGVSDEKLIDKSYTLPKDQLMALTKLMSRDDVPILIRPGENEISVRATRAQHKIFGAFVSILNPKQTTRTYNVSEGKRDNLTTLMALPSVPVSIRPGDGSITVMGSNVEQHIFAAFTHMIDPDSSIQPGESFDGEHQARTIGKSKSKSKNKNKLSRAPSPTQTKRHGIEGQMLAAASKARALMMEADRLEQIGAEIEAQSEAIEAEADALEDKADQIADEAEEALDRAEELVEQAEEMEATAARYELIAKANALKAEASARQVTVEAILAQAQAVLRQADAMEAQADAMEERAEALREQAEEIEESIESQIDSLESSLGKRYEQFRVQNARQVEAIEALISQHEQRFEQNVNTRLAAQLKQKLNLIDRVAQQRALVRSVSVK